MCSAISPIGFDPPIRTARLTLRAPTLADAPRVAMLIDDFDVSKNLTRVPHPYGLADAEQFLTRVRDPEAVDRPFAVEAEGRLVGVIGFHTEVGARLPEVGYWFGRPYWGRGYATEATVAALAWAREHKGLRGAVAGHFADNPASARVLDKVGFLYTGERVAKTSLARGEEVETRMMVWLA